ncbi:hypothetical protein RI054_02g08360 [Pseudoscourfieldia marina]
MSGLISGFSWLRYFHLGISPKFGEPTEVAHTVYQTTFYDFYGFYEFSLYDFYGLVYAADADDKNGVNDVSELPVASTTIKISELCMVPFSSLAVFLSSPGQSNYRAENAALDAAAHAAHASGEQVPILEWGAWIGGGMATNDKITIGRAERAGVGVVTPELGLNVLGKNKRK